MKTIVILHGWQQSSENWAFFNTLSPEYTVVSFDLPGFGSESLISDQWGIPEYAQWVIAQIEKHRHTDVILLGHSFGGRIAHYIAAQKPHWLQALVLYGAPVLYRPSKKIRYIIRAITLVKKFVPTKLYSQHSSPLKNVFNKVVPFDQTALASLVQVPTLLIWGERDRDVPLHIAQELSQYIKNSKLIVLDNVGHNAHLENPLLFYGNFKKFINTI